ncbi:MULTISPECIES: hypothetical protein [Amycolatopsis]|uniref:Uncharacterized protein n=1 Tax=Amycolatopsis echigonensis TaxID=2576905 RepID=A0A8E1VUB2_9PSEU|nr:MULTISPECIES: hypothetical protein [Amycolatopsis]MBB2498446.1 hypothetical protein [Amycolatopsis echigonensis]
MIVAQPKDDSERALMRDSDFASAFWSRLWIGVQLTILRERGEGDLVEATFQRLRRHQRSHFLPGLDKLGIDRTLPAAVVAARYHYLSNMLGGMAMEYVEESPRKVWIRYLPPAYTWPGNALFAVPPSVQRTMFKAWHPFNGESLGNPRLGFVVTKLYQEGGPCDEGYFQEYDHDLAPEERIQFRPVLSSPEFDPGKAPALDPSRWPLPRIAKAKRKWSREMFEDVIRCTLEMYNVDRTAALLAHTCRLFAIQYFGEIRDHVGVTGAEAADFAKIFARLGELTGEKISVSKESPGLVRVQRTTGLFGAAVPAAVYEALFEFVKTSARIHNARMTVGLASVMCTGGEHREEWLIEDAPGEER